MRAIVSVGTGHYGEKLDRLLSNIGDAPSIYWKELPQTWPTHHQVPYGFKAYAINSASYNASTILWCDSSIVPIKPLDSLFDLIEKQGYWFSENLPYGRLDLPAHNCGEWCADTALAPLGIEREEAFRIPQIIATSFGLDLSNPRIKEFFDQFMRLARDETAFKGPWRNDDGQASKDSRVKGHRHDQTVLSVLAWRYGMNLTTPPDWIVDGVLAGPNTVMEIHR